MTRPEPPDAVTPQRRAADPEVSAWVGASAGTGKTKVLTDRVLNLLLNGARPERILCLTFTKAAAAEMANRLSDRLAAWATLDDAALAADLEGLRGAAPDAALMTRARQLFAGVLDAPGGLRILTLHAFCQSVLRRFPLEAGIAPHFTVMGERDAAELAQEARDRLLESARAGGDPALAEALDTVTAWVTEGGFPDLMAALSGARGRLRRLKARHGGNMDKVVAALRDRLGVAPDETPEGVIARACAGADEDALRTAAAALAGGSRTDRQRGDTIRAWLEAGPDERAAGFDTYAGAFLTQAGAVRSTLATKKVAERAPDAVETLAAEGERLLGVAEKRRAAGVATATAALLRLGDRLLATYESAKAARALLDFDDLILTTRALLEEKTSAEWVLYKLDGGLDHILIDEAQDTSPDQWAVVDALTAEFFAGSGALADRAVTFFAVGDYKQSIYSFQGADPDASEASRRHYAERVPLSGRPWRPVDLHVSFRSAPAVLDAVNAVFRQPGAADGVVTDAEGFTHLPWRTEAGGLVEVWPPVHPRPGDAREAWKPPVERLRGDSPRARLAGMVARRIRAMVGHEVLESTGRPVRPGDVMVLVRRRGGFVDELVRALKDLDVPVAGVDRMVLTEQMAVMDLMALGRFLLLPEDDLSLAEVLKSPLVGLGEDALFDLAHERGSRSLWSALRARAGEREDFKWAADELLDLQGRVDFVRPHELFAHVLGARGGRERFLERLGPEAADPLEEFLSLTLTYETTHPPTLQGFLRWLESGSVEVKRDLEQGGDAVRVLTVHGAKGLQAPVVFLPDTLQVPRNLPSLLWDDDGLALWPPRADLRDPVSRDLVAAAETARDREYRRLLYVAMTRAEDRLYVAGWHQKTAAPDHCWYNLIVEGLRGTASEAESAFLHEEGETESTTVQRVERRGAAAAVPVAGAEEAAPATLPGWARRPPPAEPRPPRPLAPSDPGEDPPVLAPLGDGGPERFQRGLVVHRLLQHLPGLPPDQRRAAAERYLARPALALGESTRAALADEVLAVLEAPDLAPLFGPRSQAEVPLVGQVGAHVVSGQVDRLAVTDEAVWVVDYKTNRPPPESLDAVPAAYLKQMALYRALLEQVWPGRPVHCALVWTDGPRWMPVDDALPAV